MEEKLTVNNEIANNTTGGGTPLISVIIPVYNGERYIEDCYKCLENQTYKNLEIIFINDGSKDNTKNLLDELAKKDSHVVVIHKENGGVSSARNAGLDIAKGEYISFYDVDDYIESTYFEILLKDIHIHNVDIVICRSDWLINDYDAERNIDSKFDNLFNKTMNFCDDYYRYYYENCFGGISGCFGFVWGRLFKRDIVVNVRFNTKLKYYEDGLFNFEIFSQSPKTYFDSSVGYHYILRQNSAVGKAKSEFNKKCQLRSDMAKYAIENFKICKLNCTEDVIEIGRIKITNELHKLIYSLIRNNEKVYYKKQKTIISQLAKDNQNCCSFAAKLYLKLYLFSSPLCWLVSRCIAKLQKIKQKIKS